MSRSYKKPITKINGKHHKTYWKQVRHAQNQQLKNWDGESDIDLIKPYDACNKADYIDFKSTRTILNDSLADEEWIIKSKRK